MHLRRDLARTSVGTKGTKTRRIVVDAMQVDGQSDPRLLDNFSNLCDRLCDTPLSTGENCRLGMSIRDSRARL
jgi:hypothetical protein